MQKASILRVGSWLMACLWGLACGDNTTGTGKKVPNNNNQTDGGFPRTNDGSTVDSGAIVSPIPNATNAYLFQRMLSKDGTKYSARSNCRLGSDGLPIAGCNFAAAGAVTELGAPFSSISDSYTYVFIKGGKQYLYQRILSADGTQVASRNECELNSSTGLPVNNTGNCAFSAAAPVSTLNTGFTALSGGYAYVITFSGKQYLFQRLFNLAGTQFVARSKCELNENTGLPISSDNNCQFSAPQNTTQIVPTLTASSGGYAYTLTLGSKVLLFQRFLNADGTQFYFRNGCELDASSLATLGNPVGGSACNFSGPSNVSTLGLPSSLWSPASTPNAAGDGYAYVHYR